MTTIRRILPLLTLLALGACVTSKPMTIETDPPGADIYVNDIYVGAAPVDYTVVDDNTPGVVDDYTIRASKDGYKSTVRVLKDQLGTGWIPDRLSLRLAPLPGAPMPSTAAPMPTLSRPSPSPQSTGTLATPTLATEPLAVAFETVTERPDDIAVIIGNADYQKHGTDIPNVLPAYADAAGMKRYARQALGIREGNIIDLKDATSAQMVAVFGTPDNFKGQLFNWIKPGVSNIFVYYAGHGAPAGETGQAALVPADTAMTSIALTGYPLSTLYKNLSRLPARSATVVLEACFSGVSQGGSVLSSASPVFLKSKLPDAPTNLTIVTAGAAEQMASWEQDGAHSLFTKHFLLGMSGLADKPPFGDGDGRVSGAELQAYLDDSMTYLARRYYGRNQNAQITLGRDGRDGPLR